MKIMDTITDLFAPDLQISDSQLSILKAQNIETLAKWYCEINSWKHPQELFDTPDYNFVKGDIRKTVEHKIMKWIEDVIGEKEVLRYWNVHHIKSMTNEEFEQWYFDKKTMSVDEHYVKYYSSRKI